MKTVKFLIREEHLCELLEKDLKISSEPASNGFFWVTVEYEEAESDYRIVAKRESDITSYYEEKDLSRFRDCSCEHCNISRRRETLFIVENKKTGELKQVGRNCLQKYTGVPAKTLEKDFFEISESIDDLREMFAREPKFVSVRDLFLKGYGFIKENGYADKDALKYCLADRNCDEDDLPDFEEKFEKFRTLFEKMNSDAFLMTCAEIAKASCVKKDKIGIFAWMLRYFFETLDAPKTEFFGTPGDKVKNAELEITGVDVNWRQNTFSYRYEEIPEYVLTVKNKDGKEYLMVHKASSEMPYKIGAVIGQFTVKEHKERSGLKKTYINRVKLQEKSNDKD